MMDAHALSRAPRLLEARLGALEQRIRGGDEGAWPEYLATVQALAAVLAHAAPGARGRLVTTRELGELMGLSARTVLRRKREGRIAGAVQLGKRGRGALRWDLREVMR